jgi:hypothetical protein
MSFFYSLALDSLSKRSVVMNISRHYSFSQPDKRREQVSRGRRRRNQSCKKREMLLFNISTNQRWLRDEIQHAIIQLHNAVNGFLWMIIKLSHVKWTRIDWLLFTINSRDKCELFCRGWEGGWKDVEGSQVIQWNTLEAASSESRRCAFRPFLEFQNFDSTLQLTFPLNLSIKNPLPDPSRILKYKRKM